MVSLGFWDTQVHNEMSFMTENFGALANDGIRLMRHHTYLYCSPTRCVFKAKQTSGRGEAA